LSEVDLISNSVGIGVSGMPPIEPENTPTTVVSGEKSVKVNQAETLSTEKSEPKSPLIISSAQEKLIQMATSLSSYLKMQMLLLDSTESEEFMGTIPNSKEELIQSLTEQHEGATCFNCELGKHLYAILERHAGNPIIEGAVVDLLKKLIAFKNKACTTTMIMQNLEHLSRTTTIQKQIIKDVLSEFSAKFASNPEWALAHPEEVLDFLKSSALPRLREATGANPSNVFARSFLLTVLQGIMNLEGSDKISLFTALDNLVSTLNIYNSDNVATTLYNLLQEEINGTQSAKKSPLLKNMVNFMEKNSKAAEKNVNATVSKHIVKAMLANQSFPPQLMHYVLPILIKPNGPTFAQCWVDHNAKGTNEKYEEVPGKQVFFMVDLDHVGEIFVQLFISENEEIYCQFFCPEHVLEHFQNIKSKIESGIKANGYSLKTFKVSTPEPNFQNRIFSNIRSKEGTVNVKV
jgi:hypothetical protein